MSCDYLPECDANGWPNGVRICIGKIGYEKTARRRLNHRLAIAYMLFCRLVLGDADDVSNFEIQMAIVVRQDKDTARAFSPRSNQRVDIVAGSVLSMQAPVSSQMM
jgi:hypothetical protein